MDGGRDPCGFQFVLATKIERALCQQTGRAFDMVTQHRVAFAERALPVGIIRAEKNKAGCTKVRRKVRQGSIGTNEELVIGEQRKCLVRSSDVFAFDRIAQGLRHARSLLPTGAGADQQKFFAGIDEVS
jgi:hypothetical protein